MRIVFLEVDTERSWAVASIGPAFIGAFLRAHGHDVGFVRARVDASNAEVVQQVRAQAPELLGVSLTTRQWLRARDLIQAIRASLDVKVIAGGLHATFAPEQLTIFTEGGHLGNLFNPVVQKSIMETLGGLSPSVSTTK